MATSREPGGLYFDPVRKEMVDASGVVVKGADMPEKDTPPEKQPGALGALTPAQEMANAFASALGGAKAPAVASGAAKHK